MKFDNVPPEGSRMDEAEIVDIMKDVGDTIRHIRVAQRVQIAKLAELGNISPNTISQIERGVRIDRGIRQLYIVTGLLGVRLSDVLEFSESSIMSQGGPWPFDGSNSPIVAAILSTAPPRDAPAAYQRLKYPAQDSL